MMDDLAQALGAEEKAYFGEEMIAEAIADETGAPVPAETDATPEAKPETTKEDTKTEKPDAEAGHKTVPLAALHEERERRKELQTQLTAEAQERARLEGRFQQFMTALQQPQPAEQPKSVDEDPIGALKRQEQWITEQRQREGQAQQWQAQQQQVAQIETQLQAYSTRGEEAFRAEHSDYDDALKFAVDRRTAEYKSLRVAPHEIEARLRNDRYAIAMQAAQLGINPAEIVYDYAKTLGYAPKTAETPAVSGEQKMAMLEKGTQAARSLSSGGGSNSELSLQALADMPDDEFGKITDAQWRKLWGAH